ncbi:MAG: DUF465 domain-containing protein [Geminicoccaceae bacterium]|nr:DUF465 domain-containing protein [Geminicoccaceae bacterium]MCX8100475.1 DUF465 domain-containing protein [Geminicoccaceae bacterium]MDW8370479.1 DUF465 domain-containing protein [Geminicoccaceae bacterium]
MPMQEHIESLRSKHARLEELIQEELHRPLPDQGLISRLKKEKLRIKEEIERSRAELDRPERLATH